MPFDTANNWGALPALPSCRCSWRTAEAAGPQIVFEARVDGRPWAVRLNDFPEEPLYTLIVAGDEVIHFDDWPAFWGARPLFPRDRGAKTA